jgi:hypothetical protein
MLHRLITAGHLPVLTDAEESRVPKAESVLRPPKGYVISFVAFHESGFSIPARRFIRVVLFEYRLQLQHLKPNNIQQMEAFEALCEGYLGVGAHWHLFKYFFMFTFLKDGSLPATIGCTNLQMKQGRGDMYIPFLLLSSNSRWHKGWFYLKNDPKHALLEFTRVSIAKAPRNCSRSTRWRWPDSARPGLTLRPPSASTTPGGSSHSRDGLSASAK